MTEQRYDVRGTKIQTAAAGFCLYPPRFFAREATKQCTFKMPGTNQVPVLLAAAAVPAGGYGTHEHRLGVPFTYI